MVERDRFANSEIVYESSILFARKFWSIRYRALIYSRDAFIDSLRGKVSGKVDVEKIVEFFIKFFIKYLQSSYKRF